MHQLDVHYSHTDGRRQYAYDRTDTLRCCGCLVRATHAQVAHCACRCHEISRIVAAVSETF